MSTQKLYFLYCLAYFVQGLSFSIFIVYGPIYLKELGMAGLESVGYLIAIPSIAAMLGQNFWGALSFRKDRFKTMVLLSSLAFLPTFVIFATKQGLDFLFVALSIQGFLVAALFPSSQALVSIFYPEEKGDKISKMFMFESIGWGGSMFVIGTAFYFLTMPKTDLIQMGFASLILVQISSTILFYFVFPKKVEALDWSLIQNHDLKAYPRVFFTKSIFLLILFVLTLEVGSTMFFSYFSRYFQEILQGSEVWLGYGMTLATITGTLCYPLVGKLSDRSGPHVTLFMAFLSYFIIFGLISQIHNHMWVLLIYAFPVYPMVAIGSNTFIANETQEKDRAVAFGIIDTVFHLSISLSPLLGAQLLQYGGLQKLPEYSFWIVLLSGAVFLVFYSQIMKPMMGTRNEQIMRNMDLRD